MTGPVAVLLPDGRRLHLQHGPIDLVVEAFGPEAAVRGAYERAAVRFGTVLDELVAELPRLRAPLDPDGPPFRGPVARRMERAIRPHGGVFVTPMAAVAGAVADEILDAMAERAGALERFYVNNGGDIALRLAPNATFQVGIVSRVDRPAVEMTATLQGGDGVGGVATSGWNGRSHSLGVADAVTVLAADAATADAAATLIANAVDPGDDPAVRRQPARDLDPDSDLGDRPVTVAVGPLSAGAVDRALESGRRLADDLVARGLVKGAVLCLQGRARVAGQIPEQPRVGVEFMNDIKSLEANVHA